MDDLLTKVHWPVLTERLSLRRLRAEDLAQTWRYRQLPEVYEWITSAPTTFAEYQDHFAQDGRIARDVAVWLCGQGGEEVLIGTVMVRSSDAWGQTEIVDQAKGVQAELGWSFDPAFGGRGYATEAVRAVMNLCFGALGLRRVTAECFAANEPSWKLMERLGMRREAYTKADALHRNGQWMDGMYYAMLAGEWQIESTSGEH